MKPERPSKKKIRALAQWMCDRHNGVSHWERFGTPGVREYWLQFAEQTINKWDQIGTPPHE